MYPQHRMVHLMDIIAHATTRFIQSKMSGMDLWRSNYNQVEEALQQGINLCEKWIDVCQKLTSLLWPNYSPHPWKGGPYAPDHAANVQRRLREVHSLRTMHKQLTQLLSHNEQDELKTAKSFEPFRYESERTNINYVVCSLTPTKSNQNSVIKNDSLLSLISPQIAQPGPVQPLHGAAVARRCRLLRDVPRAGREPHRGQAQSPAEEHER